MTSTFRCKSIMVAVAADGAPAAIARARHLAERARASVELYAVAPPAPGYLGRTPRAMLAATEGRVREYERTLDAAARPLRRARLAVRCTVEVGADPAASIVARARQTGADCVLIQAHRHAALARVLLSQTDFDLIRLCPVPLLIVKGRRPADGRAVLAALDPWHSAGKPRSLDRQIVAAAHGMARLTDGAVHAAHVFSPLLAFVPDSTFAPVALPLATSESRRYAASTRRSFLALCERYGIAARRAHAVLGDPAFVLPSMARELRAGLVVMGAVSRSVVARLLVGNTAERVLDALPCDVLIVKPRSR